MQYFPDFGYGLHRVVYVSRSAIGDLAGSEAVVADIVARSATNNRAKGLTGALIVYEGWFLQALEGSRAAIKPLYETIAADPRHTDVTLKAVDSISSRSFTRWGMKQGRQPEGLAFDLMSASPEELLSILKLSVLAAGRRAA